MKAKYLLLMVAFAGFGCTQSNSSESMERLQTENDSLQTLINQNRKDMKEQIITSLTFQKNDAELAMNFYVDLFDNSSILGVHRWGIDGPGTEGTIMQATFELNGKKFMCSDSPPIHNWTFTPAVSNYVECEHEEEMKRLYSKLSEDGEIAMPLDNYGFSQQFAWVIDRFGVSWQLNLQ